MTSYCETQIGTFLGNDRYLLGPTTWWTFSAHPSVHTSIHSSIPAGAFEETKDRQDSCFKRRISTFLFEGKTQALLSVCDSHKLLLAPRLGIHIQHAWMDRHKPLSLFTRPSSCSLCLLLILYLLALLRWHQGAQYDMQLRVQTPPRFEGQRLGLRLVEMVLFCSDFLL